MYHHFPRTASFRLPRGTTSSHTNGGRFVSEKQDRTGARRSGDPIELLTRRVLGRLGPGVTIPS